MRIRIDQPVFLRLNLQAGDEIVVGEVSQEVLQLLAATTAGGGRYCHAVTGDGEEVADAVDHEEETRKGRSHGRRAAAVS